MMILKEGKSDTRYFKELPSEEKEKMFNFLKRRAIEVADGDNLEAMRILSELTNSRMCDIDDFIKEDEDKKMDQYNEEKKRKRIARYKRIAGLSEDFEITEDNIDEWVLRHTCYLENCNYDQFRAELLGKEWSGYK